MVCVSNISLTSSYYHITLRHINLMRKASFYVTNTQLPTRANPTLQIQWIHFMSVSVPHRKDIAHSDVAF
jgi:hypothetical protein